MGKRSFSIALTVAITGFLLCSGTGVGQFPASGKIAFESRINRNLDIYVVNADGSGPYLKAELNETGWYLQVLFNSGDNSWQTFAGSCSSF